jgi:hypothetical protein
MARFFCDCGLEREKVGPGKWAPCSCGRGQKPIAPPVTPHVTDRASIRDYFLMGYTFVANEDSTHWEVFTPDGARYATADAALCRMMFSVK